MAQLLLLMLAASTGLAPEVMPPLLATLKAPFSYW